MSVQPHPIDAVTQHAVPVAAPLATSASPHIVVSGVDKVFPVPGGEVVALKDIDLTINRGEFVCLLGPSGCGKSTLLNAIAGFSHPTRGGIAVEGRAVSEPGPDRGMVFQEYALFPWMSVAQNIAFGLEIKGMSRAAIEARVAELLDMLKLAEFRDRFPKDLSGGMRQRVAIARVLALDSPVMLMDEPFGALDALTRAHLQDQLMEIQMRLRNTVIMITHDVDEAVLLSDRIVMMTNGPSATIGEVLSVPLPRPRRRLELVEDTTYVHCRAEVLEFLYARHARPAMAA